MSVSGIQGHPLEITVFGCARLKNTEWISRQDPYVCVEYGGNRFRTRTCTDGGKNPTFQEKFVFTLIEGLREMTVAVWNSNTLTYDDFIGSGKIHLHKVLSQGFDDASWSLQSKSGSVFVCFFVITGMLEKVRLIMHYANANRAATDNANSAPPYYSQPPTAYPGSFPYPSYPPSSAYPPSAYPPPPPATYPPAPYAAPSAYYPPGPIPGIYPPHY
ncbi:hypothetical protein OIU85_001695 [Salix viminalis]|uniref:C2 domain-containing protein n=1 Tax=Salix viminalis TaxID=40686 RepID=A0A9Q0ZY40_SALVM|nr:hypothetical protein OIU85_001695 [Salix viminalis]